MRDTETARVAEATTLPDDPVAFIAEAERLANAYDPEPIARLYARDAVLDSISDGVHDTWRGKDEIAGAWELMCAASRAARLEVRKEFISAEGDTLTNEWQGTIGGKTNAAGFEIWRFDDRGELVEHRMRTFLNVGSSKRLGPKLRALISSPRMALAFVRAQRDASGR